MATIHHNDDVAATILRIYPDWAIGAGRLHADSAEKTERTGSCWRFASLRFTLRAALKGVQESRVVSSARGKMTSKIARMR
jgi:hypothetical protein